MNRHLLFALIILTLLIGIFMFEKYKKYPEYLTVVPNSMVATRVRVKKVYNIHGLTYRSTFSPTTESPVTLISLAPTDNVPSKSTIVSGIDGSGKTLSIYNIGPDSFKVIGASLDATPKSSTVTSKIGMTIGAVSSTPVKYAGDKVFILADTQIQFNNLDDFMLNRLTIICDNAVNRSLYIYFKYNNTYAGIRVNDLKDDILIINLFNS